MNIQIDIDGTIDKAPDLFKWLTHSLRSGKNTVLIVSSRTYSEQNEIETKKELKEYGVTYDRLILSPKLEDLDENRFPPNMHKGAKLYIHKLFTAEDNDVDILFDDCGITTELFRKYLPKIKVFRFLS